MHNGSDSATARMNTTAIRALKYIRLQPDSLCQKNMAQRTTIVVVFLLRTEPVLDIFWQSSLIIG